MRTETRGPFAWLIVMTVVDAESNEKVLLDRSSFGGDASPLMVLTLSTAQHLTQSTKEAGPDLQRLVSIDR